MSLKQLYSLCVYLCSLLVQDTVFSCVVTALFLRPIFQVLRQVGNARRDMRSPGQISLEKTKWLTLAGASLAVVSSTACYINFGLWVVLGGYGKPFYANPYLSVVVFGFNLDSVLNDVAMLLACGVLKKVTYEGVQSRLASFLPATAHKVEPESQPAGAHAEPSMVFTSQEGD
jgi:hypothetical protein